MDGWIDSRESGGGKMFWMLGSWSMVNWLNSCNILCFSINVNFLHCSEANGQCPNVARGIWLNKWQECCLPNDCTWNLVTKPLKTWRSFVGVIVVPLSLLLSCQIGGESRSRLQQNEDNERNQFFHLCFFSFIHSFICPEKSRYRNIWDEWFCALKNWTGYFKPLWS